MKDIHYSVCHLRRQREKKRKKRLIVPGNLFDNKFEFVSMSKTPCLLYCTSVRRRVVEQWSFSTLAKKPSLHLKKIAIGYGNIFKGF